MLKKRFCWVFVLVLALAASLQAQFTLLHSFSGSATDGADPFGSLIVSGSALYGMTYIGGVESPGVVFKINPDGKGFAVLHSFSLQNTNGAHPYGSLLLIGSTLYGLTSGAGSAGLGTIFKVNTDGTGFALLHSFAGGGTDGDSPYGSLIRKGSFLYGMTIYGGASGKGTIFRINKNGTGFALLHSFSGNAADGANPFYSSLLLKGSTLYGMTMGGGSADAGVIFKINTDGTKFRVLHSFIGGAADGAGPYGSLIRKGSFICGMTDWGGASGKGTIFKIKTNGEGFALLHSFAGATTDGSDPCGSLTLVDSKLYGMTLFGGTADYGTIFKIKTTGLGFEVLHSFAGSPGDGRMPYDSLVRKASKLFGMTRFGGATSNVGTVFSYKLK